MLYVESLTIPGLLIFSVNLISNLTPALKTTVLLGMTLTFEQIIQNKIKSKPQGKDPFFFFPEGKRPKVEP